MKPQQPELRYPVGTRIVIVDVDGATYHGLPIKTGHPEHIDKHGTLVQWREGIPLLRLDDGSEVEGCECWWVTEEGYVWAHKSMEGQDAATS